MTGFEPATLWTQTTRSTKLSYTLVGKNGRLAGPTALYESLSKPAETNQ